jgi:NMD protein affecting ribosome stability and mRNA decay
MVTDANVFVCPRCGTDVTENFYGPCQSCRSELRAKYLGEGRIVEVAEYEPKMNVTPNAVALKDD